MIFNSKSVTSGYDEYGHGLDGYNAGCRCKYCKKSAKLHRTEHDTKVLSIIQSNQDHPFHGTIYGYNIGCDCKKCLKRGNYTHEH